MISGSLSSLHLPPGQRGSRFLGSGSRATIIRAIAARLMSLAEPGITQADIDIETAIRVKDKALKLLTIPISPRHLSAPRARRYGRPGKHRAGVRSATLTP